MFRGKSQYDHFRDLENSLKTEILDSPVEIDIEYYFKKYKLEEIVIFWDKTEISSKRIIERRQNRLYRNEFYNHETTQYTFSTEFTGDPYLFSLKGGTYPSQKLKWASISNQNLLIVITSDKEEKLINDYTPKKKRIEGYISQVNKQIENFNRNLKGTIQKYSDMREKDKLSLKNIAKSLNVSVIKQKQLNRQVKLESPFSAYTGDKEFAFVSYSHSNSELVYNEIKELHDEGYRIWYDEGIPPTSEWIGSGDREISRDSFYRNQI